MSQNKVVETVREFGESTTIHGIRYITKSKAHLCERLIWFTIIAICTVVCLLDMRNLYIKWQEAPVIAVKSQKPMHVSEIPFPAVTICADTQVRSSVFKVNDEFLINYYNSASNDSSSAEKEIIIDALQYLCDSYSTLGSFHDGFIPNNNSINKILQLTNFETFVLYGCYFQGQGPYQKCPWLFKPILTDLGLCYSFNSLHVTDLYTDLFDRDRNILEPAGAEYTDSIYHSYEMKQIIKLEKYLGRTSGLEFYLEINPDEFNHDCASGSHDNFRVYIHSPYDTIMKSEDFFEISAGMQAFVTVTPELLKAEKSLEKANYKPEIRGCTFPHETPKSVFKYMTKHNCKVHDYVMMEKCNCSHFFLPLKDKNGVSLPYCPYTRYKKKCLEQNYQCPITDDMLNCYSPLEEKKCLPSCDELSFKFDVKMSKYEVDLSRWNQTKIKTSKVIIGFSDSQFLPTIIQETYSVLDFMANSGGLLGLFTGFSIISIFEILYFLSIRMYCKAKQNNTEIDDDHSTNIEKF